MNNSPTLTIPSLKGTLAKHTKPTRQPNFAKEPFSPSRSNPNTANSQKTKNGASIGDKCLIINKAQHTIRGKKHCAESANLNNITFNKRLSGLIGLCSEVRNDFLPPSVCVLIQPLQGLNAVQKMEDFESLNNKSVELTNW